MKGKISQNEPFVFGIRRIEPNDNWAGEEVEGERIALGGACEHTDLASALYHARQLTRAETPSDGTSDDKEQISSRHLQCRKSVPSTKETSARRKPPLPDRASESVKFLASQDLGTISGQPRV
jgi:hypothetical protein